MQKIIFITLLFLSHQGLVYSASVDDFEVAQNLGLDFQYNWIRPLGNAQAFVNKNIRSFNLSYNRTINSYLQFELGYEKSIKQLKNKYEDTVHKFRRQSLSLDLLFFKEFNLSPTKQILPLQVFAGIGIMDSKSRFELRYPDLDLITYYIPVRHSLIPRLSIGTIYKFQDNWGFKLAYRYFNTSRTNFAYKLIVPVNQTKIFTNSHVVAVGFNYQF